MPSTIPIQAIPNQSLTVTLDSNTFEITLKTIGGSTVASITINGVDTIDNLLAQAGALIIPARYQEAGNFMFITANYQLPYYTQFNTTQTLIYLTDAELAALRAPFVTTSQRVPTMTASSFSPIAGLPLRFSPVGYS